jgi:4-amino-4-deoxy-L-arabinose transferase-like glycosyltransferase
LVLLDELRDAWHEETRDHRLALVWLLAIAAAMRLMYLAQPMRYDEAVTYMYFVRLPWADALSTYTYPNNHVFHTLLAKASVTLFGNSPWALRLPAFLAGVLAVPATYAVARAWYGSRPALIATAIVATSGVLVLYSTNARGYSFVVLAFLVLLLLAARLLAHDRVRDWAAFTLVAALGLWTVPVMLYPLGTVAVWFALSAMVEGRSAQIRRLVLALAAGCGLTLAAYAPIIGRDGVAAITRNKFVTPSGWFEFFNELPRTWMEVLQSWTLGVPPLISLALLLLAALALRRHGVTSRFRIGVPLAAFVWCAWLLVVNHRAPFARVWLWLLPVAACLAAVELILVLEGRPRTRVLVERRMGLFAVAFAFGLATCVVTSFGVLLSRDTGTFRDADEAAAFLSGVMRPDDLVLAGIPSNGPLDYYLHRRGVDRRSVSYDRLRRVFVIVDAGEGQTLDQLTTNSSVRDTTRFTPAAVVATLPLSRIYLFERRSVATR